MWLWRSVVMILLVSSSYGAPTSLGPTSNEEAELLWKQGQSALQNSEFQDAANSLQRYVDRYPSKSGYLRAHLLLGKALLGLGKALESLAPLKYFISATGTRLESIEARLAIGHAYLDLKKFHEAYLSTIEIEQMQKQGKLSSDVLLESLLIKSQALLGLHHDSRAILSLESAEKQVSEQNSPSVKGQVLILRLKLKALDCARFPSQDLLDESQIRDQLDRRGTCLLEAFLVFKKILQVEDPLSATEGVEQISEGFKAYRKASIQTPALSRSPVKRSRIEQKHYQSELSFLLLEECKKKISTALNLLTSWKETFPKSMEPYSMQVSKNLEQLVSRNL